MLVPFGLPGRSRSHKDVACKPRTSVWPPWSSSAGPQLRRHQVGLEGIPPLLLGALRFIGVVFPAILLVPRPAMPWRWLLAYGGAISLGQFLPSCSAP